MKSFLFNLLMTSAIMLSMAACHESPKEIMQDKEDTPTKKTQIILKVQPHAYNDTEKTLISGDYISEEKISVPKSLSGQNKWFMFEGPVLENDKIAYRYYADYRHRYDIYGKKVNDLVMDTVSWDYHNIMDWGSDILKVGNSLGIGSPGIYVNDTVYTLSNWESKDIEVIKDGDEESILRTTFHNLNILDEKFTVIQDWSLSAGNFWTEIKLSVKDGKLPDNMSFATGIVKHLPNVNVGESENMDFAYTWGSQSYHEEDLGMAIMADKSFGGKMIPNDLSHLMVFNTGESVTYRFMAMWKEGLEGPKDSDEFELKVKESAIDKI